MKQQQNHLKRQFQRRQTGFSLIELLIVVAIIGILAAVALPKLQDNLKLGRQTAAVQSLRSIHNSEAQFNAMKGKFGSLKDLSDSGLLGTNFSSGNPVGQYSYTSPVAESDKYCVQATRQSPGTAYRDFNVTEDGTIRFVEAKTVNALPPGEGQPIGDGETGPANNAPAAAQPKQ